jgi:hypothetical protein
MFANAKAQSWWMLRKRFQDTHRAVTENRVPDDVDELISISPSLTTLNQLVVELSQPTYSISGSGKILVDKSPDGTKSPNLADAVMIAFSSSIIVASDKRDNKKKDKSAVHGGYGHAQGWMK